MCTYVCVKNKITINIGSSILCDSLCLAMKLKFKICGLKDKFCVFFNTIYIKSKYGVSLWFADKEIRKRFRKK